MTDYPKISIITPSFNQGQFLEQTILSVLNQGYPNLEYIIIDGGSTDGSVDIIKKYESQVVYWVSEKDKGQSDAINKGFEKCTGEIVNWLNSDDYYELGVLTVVAENFLDKKVNIASGKGRLFDEHKTLGYTKGVDVYKDNLAKTIGWARMDQPETFYRKSILDNLMPLSIDLHYLMDRKLWMDYLFTVGLNGIRKIDIAMVNFRMHPGSKTVSYHYLFQRENDTLFYNLAKQYNLEHYQEIFLRFFEIDRSLVVKPFPSASAMLVEKVLNYFLLIRGNERYYNREKENAENIFNAIQFGLLLKEDQALFKSLHFRNKYIPGSVLKILSKYFSH